MQGLNSHLVYDLSTLVEVNCILSEVFGREVKVVEVVGKVEVEKGC